jgi:hypothetical protein
LYLHSPEVVRKPFLAFFAFFSHVTAHALNELLKSRRVGKQLLYLTKCYNFILEEGGIVPAQDCFAPFAEEIGQAFEGFERELGRDCPRLTKCYNFILEEGGLVPG